MKYQYSLALRYLSCLILALFPSLYYLILSPITLYLSYFFTDLIYSTSLSGNILNVAGKELEFIPACTAAAAYLLLTIFILLTKGISFKKGLRLFIIGSLLILAANIVRIELLIVILIEKGTNLFNTLHLFIWKVLASVYVALVWIFLVKRYKIKEVPLVSDFIYLKRFIIFNTKGK